MVGSVGAYVSVVDLHRTPAKAGTEVKVFRSKLWIPDFSMGVNHLGAG